MPEIPDITPFRKRREELDQAMAEPDFFADQRRSAELSREHQHLGHILSLHDRLEQLDRQLRENEVLLADKSAEAELLEMAREEAQALEAERETVVKELLVAMLPPDPTDSRNTVVEIRAGAGGDEASLFAADLYRMYSRYAENRGWKVEPMGASESEAGGFKEVSFLIAGEDVYKAMKYESGVHRVQRVPVTEAGGRIHTSAATVAVLPEPEDVETKKRAQTGMKFLQIPSDPRAVAMGNAVTASNYGSSRSLFHNPASMARLERTFHASAGNTGWIGDVNYNMAALSMSPANGRYGVIGLSLISVDYGDIIATVVDETAPDGYSDYTDIGLSNPSPSALAVGLGYAKALTDRAAVYDGLGTPLQQGIGLEGWHGSRAIRTGREGADRFARGEGRAGEGIEDPEP